MSIISPADFIGPELNIPNTDKDYVAQGVQWVINEYEPIFLTELLGATLYAEFEAGLILDPVPDKWVALRDKLKPALLRYLWFWWAQSQITQITGSGVKVPTTDNSVPASSWGLQCAQWNRMVRLNYQTQKFLIDNKTDYPDFTYTDPCYYMFFCGNLDYCAYWYERLYYFLGCQTIPDIYRFKNSLGL